MLPFFSKTEEKDLMLPFKYISNPDDEDAGLIGIEVFGDVLGETKYCYAMYLLKDKKMYSNGEYEEIVNLLKNQSERKTVKVTIKIKNGKAKDFRIDLNSLAECYNDDRFKNLELSSWGLNNVTIN